MITDKNRKVVKEGNVIEFGKSGIPYKIILKDGHLGAYENGEFIRLKDCLKNSFVVTDH